jgi:hypothetical protein
MAGEPGVTVPIFALDYDYLVLFPDEVCDPGITGTEINPNARNRCFSGAETFPKFFDDRVGVFERRGPFPVRRLRER